MATDRQAQYAALVAARKLCRACEGLLNPSVVAGGAYDSAAIGPWTRWQGALDADLMLVGQDWGDLSHFTTQRGLANAENTTNRRLVELLSEAGLWPARSEATTSAVSSYFTNAILCLKSGGLSAPVQSAWFRECGERFLRPQIELVRPRAVVTLGERAYRAVCRAFGLGPGTFRSAVERVGVSRLFPGVTLFAVYHCSPRVLAGARSLAQQRADWRRIGVALGSIPQPDDA